MHKQRFPNLMFGASLRPDSAALATLLMLLFLILVLLFITFTAQPAQAQAFTVVHNFTGGPDGANPRAGLTMDKAGNLYGTTYNGGQMAGSCSSLGCGTVFKLTHKGSGWIFSPLYSFAGDSDGFGPMARPAIGADGSLYGTTTEGGWVDQYGGCYVGCGTVFRLRPKATPCKTTLCPWEKKEIYAFHRYDDGSQPQGNLTFDQQGNIYGTTFEGGYGNCGFGYDCGLVYELIPSGGSWNETVLYYGDYGRGNPPSGVIFDKQGYLYGVLSLWRNETGMVYQLAPSGSGWNETMLHQFSPEDGTYPIGGLIFDNDSKNLYGTTSYDGTNDGSQYGGTVFSLTPSGDTWKFAVLVNFPGPQDGACGPRDELVMDGHGNLYGTTYCSGYWGYGSVFKLTPSGGSWTLTTLHDFTGGDDGKFPWSSLVFDANGNLYGTTEYGGNGCSGDSGCGVVFQITP